MSRRLIVVAADGPGAYSGVDRPQIGSVPGVAEATVLRGIEIEDAPAEIAAARFPALARELRRLTSRSWELIATDTDLDLGWELLGYDVAETTPAGWSALAHAETFLDEAEREQWIRRLNHHGLFDRLDDAEAFLSRYLAGPDPDSGWTREGWTDEPDIYAVLPVRRLRTADD